jgi:hypothetical protein
MGISEMFQGVWSTSCPRLVLVSILKNQWVPRCRGGVKYELGERIDVFMQATPTSRHALLLTIHPVW